MAGRSVVVARRKLGGCGNVGDGGARLDLRESKEVGLLRGTRGRAVCFHFGFIIYFLSLLEDTMPGTACAGRISRRLSDPRHVNSC